MFDQFTGGTSRRDVLRASAVGVGASLGLVGTAGASDHVVEFDESITITPEDSGRTFVQTADFEGDVNIRPGVEDVTVDGNGYTISGGGVGGGSYDETVVSNVTLQNLHLRDRGIGFTEIDGLVVRNNIVQWFELEYPSGVRAVDNTIARGIETFENASENLFARNVTKSIVLYDDLSGSHKIANNFFTGGESGSRIGVQVTNAFDGRLEILDNYVGNADGPGVDLEDAGDLKPIISRNAVVGNGGHGVNTSGTRVAKMEENVFIGNGGHGVDAPVGTFRNNFATSNDGDGFRIGIGGDCLRNAAISNGGAGFRVYGSDVKFGFNCATGNDGDGVVLDGATGLAVRKNAVTGNGGDGLVLEDADDNGVTRNRVCGNDGEELVVGDDADGNRFANNLVC